MKNCVLRSNPHRAFSAIMRRAIAFCVLFACLFPLSAFALEIPKFVTRIENGAFMGDKSLKSVVIPASVTYIGEEAFADCPNLTSIKIMGKNVTFGENALGRLGEDRTVTCYSDTNVYTYVKRYEFTFDPIDKKSTTLLAYADTLVGRPYSEMDCVEFVNKCFKDALGMKTGAATTNGVEGWRVGHTNFGELEKYNKNAMKITKITDLQPGDIICWKEDNKDYCTHVGIYVGKGTINGKQYSSGVFIDSSNGAEKVDYRLIPATGTGYYTRNFMFAWRLIDF